MSLIALVRRLRNDPYSLLDSKSVISLGAFWSGYGLVDEAANDIGRELMTRYPGPSAASGFTRAYLTHGEGAYEGVVDNLEEITRERAQVRLATPGVESFVEYVRRPILSGRYGLALGEPSIIWLANCWAGYTAASAETPGARSSEDEEAIRGFESWIDARYSCEGARWYAAIRVFEGSGVEGLRSFIRLWDEYSGSMEP